MRPSVPSLRLLLACAALVPLAACEFRTLHHFGGESISISNDGDSTRIRMSSAGYSVDLDVDGRATFLDDESDVATLSSGGSFELTEELDGVERTYRVVDDLTDGLVRTFEEDGVSRPFDDEAKRWLAEALPRLFRETGYDAEARVERLLARGGPDRVLDEIELGRGDWARATYSIRLFELVVLAEKPRERAFGLVERLESDYEARRALAAALAKQELDDAGLARLLGATRNIESDYELAELLIATAPKLQGEAARTSWLEAARTLDSDWESRRSFEAGLAGKTPTFSTRIVALAAERIDSNYELRCVLDAAAPQAGDAGLAAQYVTAARQLSSDYERKLALNALLEHARLATTELAAVLDAVAEMSSDFERREVLVQIAPLVAGDEALARKYREVAAQLSDWERGQALEALERASVR
ncbi:MAG: hypothetical protein L6Q99_15915 [Planctomycetes bacterium]|nr:hypothetical protein [Planctomycetota bacterium]